jgi:hypothetical protein
LGRMLGDDSAVELEGGGPVVIARADLNGVRAGPW